MSRRRPTQLRSDLRAMSADASAFSVMVGIGETYLPAFALAVGVGEVAAGLLASVPPLAGAVLQLASPAAVRQLGSHRRWVVVCAVTQALSFVPLIVAALAGAIPTLLIFLVATLYWGSGMGTGPAWNTWVGTIVPSRLRAGYFSRRTRITQVGVLGGLLLGGAVLQAGTEMGQRLQAFAVLFLGAAACRVASARLLAATSEPIPLPENYRRVPATEVLGRLVRRSQEGRLLLYLLSVQTAVNLSAPYFTPYMLGQLRLSYAGYMVLVAGVLRREDPDAPDPRRTRATLRRTAPLVGGWTRHHPPRVAVDRFRLVSLPAGGAVRGRDRVGCLRARDLLARLRNHSRGREDERAHHLQPRQRFGDGGGFPAWRMASCASRGAPQRLLGDLWPVFLLARAATVLFLVRVPTPTLAAVPVAVRTVAVRPSAGSIDRPILPSIRQGADEPAAPEPGVAPSCADLREQRRRSGSAHHALGRWTSRGRPRF